MFLRRADFHDIEELTELYTITNEVINVRNNDFDPDNEAWPSVEMIKDAVEGQEQIVGIEDDRIVLAVIVNNRCDDAYYSVKWMIDVEDDKFQVVHALRVLPEYEGRGFAKQALSFIIEEAAKSGVRTIRLDVLDGYGVEKLYEDLDFVFVDKVDIFYEDIGYPKKFKLFERVI